MKQHLISTGLLVLAAGCVAPEDSFSVHEQAVEAELAFDVASPNDLGGRFWSENGMVRFTSHTEFRRSVTATMEVGESRISIDYDPRAGDFGALTLDIRGKLVVRERLALGDFARALYDRYPEAGDASEPAAGILRTFADYLEGWSLGPTDPKITTFVTQARRLEEPDHETPGDPGPTQPPKDPPGGGAPVCNITNDQDGVTEIPQCCNGGAMKSWSHDAVGHCFVTNTDMCGWPSSASPYPDQNECPGRCGAGCFGAPLYTQDCLDHDKCLNHHPGFAVSPWDDCGDELLDALDDFIGVYFARLGWFFAGATGCNY